MMSRVLVRSAWQNQPAVCFLQAPFEPHRSSMQLRAAAGQRAAEIDGDSVALGVGFRSENEGIFFLWTGTRIHMPMRAAMTFSTASP
jgi:hypothetical protein